MELEQKINTLFLTPKGKAFNILLSPNINDAKKIAQKQDNQAPKLLSTTSLEPQNDQNSDKNNEVKKVKVFFYYAQNTTQKNKQEDLKLLETMKIELTKDMDMYTFISMILNKINENKSYSEILSFTQSQFRLFLAKKSGEKSNSYPQIEPNKNTIWGVIRDSEKYRFRLECYKKLSVTPKKSLLLPNDLDLFQKQTKNLKVRKQSQLKNPKNLEIRTYSKQSTADQPSNQNTNDTTNEIVSTDQNTDKKTTSSDKNIPENNESFISLEDNVNKQKQPQQQEQVERPVKNEISLVESEENSSNLSNYNDIESRMSNDAFALQKMITGKKNLRDLKSQREKKRELQNQMSQQNNMKNKQNQNNFLFDLFGCCSSNN